jgi:phosphatidylserine synthase
VAVAAAFRLAKFNQDASQSKIFKGLPSPAAALTLLGPAIQAANTAPFEPHWVIAPAALLAWGALVALLMVSNLKLFSFKQPIRTTWPYLIGIAVIGLGSLPILQGGCTIVATAAYVLASQLYFRLHPIQA